MTGRSLLRGVATAAVPVALALLGPACHRSSGSDPVPAAGTAIGALPDSRVFFIDANDATLRVLDGNNPTASGVSAAIALGGARCGGVTLDPHGNRLWIALEDRDEVAVFDAATLARLATLAAGDAPGAIFADGANGRIFVANEGANTVTIRDADPPFAEVAGSPLATGAFPADLLVSGTTLVVANRTDGTISVYSTATLLPATGSPFAVEAGPEDLESDPAEGLVFVANRAAGSISVFHIATLVVTTPITGLALPEQLARHGRRDLLFLAEGGGNVRAYASTAALTEESGSPIGLGAAPTGIEANGFLDRVFVATDAAGGVRILEGAPPFGEIDATNRPAVGSEPGHALAIEPVILRTLISPAGGTVEGSLAAGGRLYLAHGTAGVKILDAGDPRATWAAAELGTLLMPDSAIALQVDGSFAFVSNGAQGVQVADVGDPATPVIERTVNGIGTADESFLFSRFLLVDSGSAGLRVLDVASPTDAEEVAAENPGGGGTGFDFSAEHRFAYSASGGTDIRVIDLIDPLDPVTVETVPIPVDADDVAALPDRVVAVAAASGGLRLVQINPTSGSVLLGQLDLGVAARKVSAFFDLALVTDSANDLHVVNAANPEHPVRIGLLDLAAEPKEIRLVENQLHVAEGATGLVIYRFLP